MNIPLHLKKRSINLLNKKGIQKYVVQVLFAVNRKTKSFQYMLFRSYTEETYMTV